VQELRAKKTTSGGSSTPLSSTSTNNASVSTVSEYNDFVILMNLLRQLSPLASEDSDDDIYCDLPHLINDGDSDTDSDVGVVESLFSASSDANIEADVSTLSLNAFSSPPRDINETKFIIDTGCIGTNAVNDIRLITNIR
jgi:hypothetical protein